MSDQPSDCGQCRRYFMTQPLLQAEMRHTAAKLGVNVAESELNERLEERHADHLRDKGEPR